jgi:anti-anti-sigma factor
MLGMSISGEDCESDSPAPGQVVVGQYGAGGAWVVAAQGDLDLESLPPLRAALEAAAAAHPVVVLDVGAVTFGDSTFLGVLLGVRQLTALRVAGAGHALLRLFSVVGADLVLDLYGSVAEALAADPD